MASLGTQEWTRTRLDPHKQKLWKCLKAGVSRYNKLSPDNRLAFGARCEADVLNAFIIAEARSAFDGVADSEFKERNNTTYHSLAGCVLWYKQLGSNRMPSNIPTLTVDQMMQGQFDFMPDKLLVVVGFELDALKSSLKSVDVMRFGPGRRVEFVIELTEIEASLPSIVEIPSQASKPKRKRTLVQLRNGFEQKSFGNGEG